MNRTFFITGISGHLGRTIAHELLLNNEKVVGFVMPNEKNLNIKDYPNNKNLTIVYGTVLNEKDLDTFLTAKNNTNKILIHCAGLISISKKYEENVYKVNVDGTKLVTNKAIEHKVHKYIYVSSVHAIKENGKNGLITETLNFNPDDVEGTYAKTKAIATAYVLAATKDKINTTVVHPSGIMGPNDFLKGNINSVLTQYLKGSLTAIVKGGYDVVDVRDVAHGIISAVEHGKDHNTYILSGNYVSIKKMLDIASDFTNKKKIKFVLPSWFITLTMPMIALHFVIRRQKPLFTLYSLRTLISNSNFSNEKARKDLNYAPRDIKITINDTINWLIKYDQI